jgi:hypothetical protein
MYSICKNARNLVFLRFPKHPDKPCCASDLRVDGMDEALFTAATMFKLATGKMAKFWTSSWLNGAAPAAMFPDLYDHSRRKQRTVAAALTNGQWIQDLLYNITPHLLSQYTLLWELVQAATANQNSQVEDAITWTRSGSGEYSTKFAYYMLFDGAVVSTFPATVWKIWAPSKCKFFLCCSSKIESGPPTDYN